MNFLCIKITPSLLPPAGAGSGLGRAIANIYARRLCRFGPLSLAAAVWIRLCIFDHLKK